MLQNRRHDGHDRRMRLPLVLAVAVLLSACGGGEEPAADPSPAAPGADVATTQAPDDPATTTADGVSLEADGLQATELFAFDDAEQEPVTAAVEAVLDRAPTSQESQMECGPGPLDAVSWDGLDLYFLDGTFVGWYLDQPQPAGVQTAGDVQLGTTTLGELRGMFDDVTLEESTLGNELSADGISGVVSSADDTGTVEVVWAGATCIAR